MTRRKVIFYNDLNNSYIVSEEYNGDKVEMARFGCNRQISRRIKRPPSQRISNEMAVSIFIMV